MDDVRQAVFVTEIASSDWLWTRAAVRGGRIFVCYPRWFAYVPMSLGEVVSPNRVKPYPDAEWNSRFICVQSVYFDDEGFLWVLDSACPRVGPEWEHKLDPNGPTLYRFNLNDRNDLQIHKFSKDSYRENSYFNDVRIYRDREKNINMAFITDSDAGALIVRDLDGEEDWRLLDYDKNNPSVKAHHSVQAEEVVLTIEGQRWLQKSGEPPKVHSDGIALSPDRKYLYYQALTGRTLYRIPTASLIENRKNSDKLFSEVQEVGQTGAADGIQFGADGRLYFTAIEKNAITRLVHPHDSHNSPKGEVETVFCDKDCKWPDSITRDTDGSLYVTTSLIHLQRWNERPRGPFKLFRLQVGKLGFF